MNKGVYVFYEKQGDKRIPRYVGIGGKGRPIDHVRGAQMGRDMGNNHLLHCALKDRPRDFEWSWICPPEMERDEAGDLEISLIRKFGRQRDGGTLFNRSRGGEGSRAYVDDFDDKLADQYLDRLRKDGVAYQVNAFHRPGQFREGHGNGVFFIALAVVFGLILLSAFHDQTASTATVKNSSAVANVGDHMIGASPMGSRPAALAAMPISRLAVPPPPTPAVLPPATAASIPTPEPADTEACAEARRSVYTTRAAALEARRRCEQLQ